MANLPNPFWSDAVQQEFRRAQQMVQEDPGERGAATREGDESEREPPYEFGPQAQETPEAGASTARDNVPHEPASCPAEVHRVDPVALATQPQEPEALAAREASPAHYSVTGLSELSTLERGGVRVGLESSGLKEVDDRELVPDYGTPPVATQSGNRDPFGDLGSMLRVLMQGQQSLVERMDKLESSKASSSSAGASSSISEPRPKAVFPPQFVGRPAVTGKPANLGETGTGPGGEMSQLGPPTETQAQAPSAGVVELEGSKYAWRITPEGLKLEKQTANVAEALSQRARSPFKPRNPNSPKQTQKPRTRNETSQRSRQPVRTAGAQEAASKLFDVGGCGRSTTVAGVPWGNHGQGRGSLSRTGLLRYPVSPGGTEIRPPPDPVPTRAGDLTEPQQPEEPIKHCPDLPVLEEYDPDTSSITAGDWLATLGPSMSSLSPNAREWWASVTQESRTLYAQWLSASPLDRLKIKPESLVELHQTGRFSRVEQKAVPMLLKSIGAELREDVVTSRLFSAAAIVYKTMCRYQPGGRGKDSDYWNTWLSLSPALQCQKLFEGSESGAGG